MKLRTFLMLFLPVSALAADLPISASLSSHIRDASSSCISVPVVIDEKARKGGLFRNEIWAFRIHSVRCDGKNIGGKPHHGLFNDPDFRTFSPSANIVVYQLLQSDLLFATDFDVAQGRYQLMKYDLPVSFQELVIQYRIVYPDGTLGRLLEARSIDYNSFGLDESSDAQIGQAKNGPSKAKCSRPKDQAEHNQAEHVRSLKKHQIAG